MSNSKLVTVGLSDTADGPVRLLVQTVGDRERHLNGTYIIEPGQTRQMLLDPSQCFRVEDVEEGGAQ